MNKHNRSTSVAAVAPLLLYITTMMGGCGDGDTGSAGLDDTGGTPLATCEFCEAQETEGPDLIPVACVCPDPANFAPTIIGSGCAFSDGPINVTDCQESCESLWAPNSCAATFSVADCGRPEPLACYSLPDSGNCTGWSPVSAITLSGGIYYVDATFVSDLVDDTSPLWSCDDAYFIPKTTTRFSLANAGPGELLYELGLRNKDVPVAINGLPLEDLTDVIAAFTQLWFYEGATSFDLEIKRANVTLHRIYVLQ